MDSLIGVDPLRETPVPWTVELPPWMLDPVATGRADIAVNAQKGGGP